MRIRRPSCRGSAEGKFYNPYFATGHWIGMPPPLTDGQVTFDDGAPTQSTTWPATSQPSSPGPASPRWKSASTSVSWCMIYLAVFAVLLYLVKRRIWGRHE